MQSVAIYRKCWSRNTRGATARSVTRSWEAENQSSFDRSMRQNIGSRCEPMACGSACVIKRDTHCSSAGSQRFHEDWCKIRIPCGLICIVAYTYKSVVPGWPIKVDNSIWGDGRRVSMRTDGSSMFLCPRFHPCKARVLPRNRYISNYNLGSL